MLAVSERQHEEVRYSERCMSRCALKVSSLFEARPPARAQCSWRQAGFALLGFVLFVAAVVLSRLVCAVSWSPVRLCGRLPFLRNLVQLPVGA